ncbi:flavoprotein [Streptomyces millisiae]|uniref:Flavoprotein n=1 Tax=Streptomyces millisiae TaxID=3075542 RepID=A0ABU2LWZ4_9ACTN|nr:flavoprotein [Streptomyces sp. DSM 44918]MDT0322081.1 flavoprotein [Streptomyces sp. DSM 44918]
MTNRVLHLLACAAPPVRYVDRAIRAARAGGWEVCLGMTPTAADWLADRLAELATLTGHPVRVEHRAPGAHDGWPSADVTAVTPATLNTVNAVALGLTPTWVAAHACEALGKRRPLIVMPCVNSAYASHPQFDRSVATLRATGARVLLGPPDGFVPNPPGQGRPESYPWHLALAAAEAMS